MKNKHNKKRNTALVYEALVKEMTAAILRGDQNTKDKITNIVKKHFSFDTILKKDLECYQSIIESYGSEEDLCKKVINEVKLQKRLIDPSGLFKAQSDLIKDINLEVDSNIFNNFVPNYKSLATIDQMFSLKTSPRERIMLESKLISFMTEAVDIQQADNVDSLIVAKFVEKFNNKYDNELLDEQKELLNQYILSFTDNSLGLKTFLNSEIGRLKEELNNSFDTKEISEDENMTSKTRQVVEKLTAFSKLDINEEILLTVLKTQELVKEIYSDGTNS
jgi:hypothetical protein